MFYLKVFLIRHWRYLKRSYPSSAVADLYFFPCFCCIVFRKGTIVPYTVPAFCFVSHQQLNANKSSSQVLFGPDWCFCYSALFCSAPQLEAGLAPSNSPAILSSVDWAEFFDSLKRRLPLAQGNQSCSGCIPGSSPARRPRAPPYAQRPEHLFHALFSSLMGMLAPETVSCA